MSTQKLLERFSEIATNPKKMKDNYINSGKKIVLTAPYYTPNEIIHSMGLIPFGAWGADTLLQSAKEYFPTFICSIVQSIVELGIRGSYNGASALVVPSLCDSLKCVGENWKYAVPHIPFVPMVYPQNRKGSFGLEFCKASYLRVISNLEKITGAKFNEENLQKSLCVYNEHNAAMRELGEMLSVHPEISAASRNDVYKSAFFMECGEHTRMVKELVASLEVDPTSGDSKIPIIVSGVLFDSPSLLEIVDSLGYHIVADDVAAKSRQYRTDSVISEAPLDDLAQKFADMGNCSVLFDADKKKGKSISQCCQRTWRKGCGCRIDQILRPRGVRLRYHKEGMSKREHQAFVNRS
jgi:benzoyl-CoA reductase/2-hydroxyglutaryl-CoA dehydratase subunit BcrC/BadD/HgdB